MALAKRYPLLHFLPFITFREWSGAACLCRVSRINTCLIYARYTAQASSAAPFTGVG